MKENDLPIAIIGGGPVGMAAAAHLARSHRSFILLEAANTIGANIKDWGHVRLFSPWEYNIDKAAELLLKEAGIPIPDKSIIPYGHEIVNEYLQPLANIRGIKEHIHLNAKVLSIGRDRLDKMKDANRESLPFAIRVLENGEFKGYKARAVIDATGTWNNPNPLGSGGVEAIGEKQSRKQIYYGIPDIKGTSRKAFEGKSTLVVGGGHSAVGSIIALNELKEKDPNTRIHWIMRKSHVSDVYGGQEADQFKARGALGIQIEQLVNSGALEIHTPVFIHEISRIQDKLSIKGLKGDTSFSLNGIDAIITNTGSRPDFSFLREVRFDTDASLESVPALANLIDPNIHSCGTVRAHGEAELRQKEKDFYIVGAKSYGRAPTFLMATGYEQVRSVVAHMNGDYEGAKRVELYLPETGVCSSGLTLQPQKTEDVDTNCTSACSA